jgi:hypothetical protein
MARLLSVLSLGIAIVAGSGVAEATECIGAATVRTSRIAGQVFYPEGIPIAEARITISTPDYRADVEIETDADGYFEGPSWRGRGLIQVRVLGYRLETVPIEVDPRERFRQVAVSLDHMMVCGSACSILLPAPTRLSKPPSCLPAARALEVASIKSRLALQAKQCSDGNEETCRRLARVATKDKNSVVREYAAQVLPDQRLLSDLAREASDAEVRAMAVARLNDPAVVATFAEGDPSPRIRRAALGNRSLTDQTLFERAASGDPDPNVRHAAIDRITDQGRIAGLLKGEKDYSRRHQIVVHALTDQKVLADLAMHDPAPGVRFVAATRLDDQALAQRVYAEVVQSDGWGRWHWAAQAAGRLTDQTLLAKIATTDPELRIRSRAIMRLTDQTLLARIATTDADPMCRRIAAVELTDRALLERIAKDDPDWWVRKAAQDALKGNRGGWRP